MAIKVPSEIIPNATDQKVTDAKYVKHTHHEGESDEEIMTQSSINESVLDGDIFKTINGNSIVGEGNIYTSTDSYVVCNSAASDNPKVIIINNYQQVNGGNIRIKFTNANTAAPASGEDAVKLKIMTGTSTYVDGYLYYNGNPVDDTNGWSVGETVTVYYDDTTSAEKYMANNVKGVNLRTDTDGGVRPLDSAQDEVAISEKAVSELRGTTSDTYASNLTLYGLKAGIDDIRNSTATTGMTLDGLSSESFARFTDTTQTLRIVGTCSISTQMTLSQNGTVIDSDTGTSCTFNVTVTPMGATNYTFTMTFGAGSVKSRSKYVYYVFPIYYGTFDNSITYSTDELLGLNGETRLLTTYTTESNKTPTRSAKLTYPMYFDDTDRRIYIAIPTTGIASGYNIDLNKIYLGGTGDPAKKLNYFSKISTSEEEANTGYSIYATDTNHPVNPGVTGNINVICQ